MICSYVFDELPKIYKLVTENKPLKIETSCKTKKSSLVNCDQCKFKSSIIHIKTNHDSWEMVLYICIKYEYDFQTEGHLKDHQVSDRGLSPT